MLNDAVAMILAWEKHPEAPLGLKLDSDEKSMYINLPKLKDAE